MCITDSPNCSLVGSYVGRAVDTNVGDADGDTEYAVLRERLIGIGDSPDGALVGSSVGGAVGAAVGDAVGQVVSAGVGEHVGDGVGSP